MQDFVAHSQTCLGQMSMKDNNFQFFFNICEKSFSESLERKNGPTFGFLDVSFAVSYWKTKIKVMCTSNVYPNNQ